MGTLARYALSVGAAAALLAGCAGSQSAALPPPLTAMPSAKGLKQWDLLYVSNANGLVNVYRYWQHPLIDVLTEFTQPKGECSDGTGDVYITDHLANNIYEYPHGGKKAINTLDDSPNMPETCFIDHTTGNLAVANDPYGYYSKGSIAIYRHAKGYPKLYYGSSYNDHFVACAYDDRGDLLAASRYGYLSFYTEFFYLPKDGKQMLLMKLPRGSASEWGFIEGISWDGNYWVVDSGNVLYRFSINVNAKYISSTTLRGGYGVANQVWLYRKDFKSTATEVVGSTTKFDSYTKNSIEFWQYPAGGNPIGSITRDLDQPFGVTVSLGTP